MQSTASAAIQNSASHTSTANRIVTVTNAQASQTNAVIESNQQPLVPTQPSNQLEGRVILLTPVPGTLNIPITPYPVLLTYNLTGHGAILQP